MALREGGGKLPGKTVYSGRRRPMTRKSGFKVHDQTTGGEFERVPVDSFWIKTGQQVTILFRFPKFGVTELVGFGGWFSSDKPVVATIDGGFRKRTLSQYRQPSWNKFGSLWRGSDLVTDAVRCSFLATEDCRIAFHVLQCGVVDHKHFTNARTELMPNMYQFAPEALFISQPGSVEIRLGGHKPIVDGSLELIRKSCNRCGRFLPINIDDERNHLSFSNHCTASHRCPCTHATFSKLTNREDPTDKLLLQHGYQLECRFCKKFEVNAAHNPLRTVAQMKEDGARRRAFELLIAALEGGSSQLNYRPTTGKELAEDIYKKFGGHCFNCAEPLDVRGFHLDHTRPLALLWPLDGTATALCGPCNSDKHDRSPAEFYTPSQLERLSEITGIPFEELEEPTPNVAAIEKLAKRLGWFFDEFLCSDEMKRVHDGKVAGELLLKALYKALARSSQKFAKELIHKMKQRETGT